MMAFFLFGTVTGFVPFLGVVSFVLFLAALIVLLVFIDGTMLAAMEIDFFHRNTLHWRQVRVPFFIVWLVSVPLGFLDPGPPFWATIFVVQFLIVLGLILGFSVAALVAAARRTPDRTLKRHVRLLGVSLALFVSTFLITSTFPFPSVLAGYLLGPVSVFFLYLAVMSLSPVRKIEKEVVSAVPTVS